jgi:hypothetical protein
MTIVDTPDGIATYQMLAIRAALRIEVHTGLRHSRGSVMKLAKRLYGIRRNTKKGVLAELDKIIMEVERHATG